MPNNDFAPYLPFSTVFIVQNIASNFKIVRIFNYPILYGTTRDLMKIPGVAESDIRASLLKGEVRNKILAKEITVIESDIDLLQFNSTQYQFLTDSGITFGTKITPDQAVGFGGSGSASYTFRQQIIPIGALDGSNRLFITPDKFIDGTWNGNTFRITVNYNGRQLVKDVDYTISESGGAGTGFNTITFISFTPLPKQQLTVDYTVKVL